MAKLKYLRWESARKRRIAEIDRKIEKAKEAGDSQLVQSLVDQRTLDAAHTSEFWANKWREIKSWAKDKGIDIRETFKSKRAFQSVWLATAMEMESDKGGNIMKEIKYGLQYDTAYVTALTEYRMIKNLQAKAKEEEENRRQELQKYQEQGIPDEEIPAALREPVETPKQIRLKDLQKMSTRQFADLYKSQIMADYRRLRDEGMKSPEAKAMISNTWFASP